MSSRCRMTVAVLLTLALATTAALAQPSVTSLQTSSIVLSDPIGLWTRLWNVLTRQWGKNGPEVDPNGRFVPAGNVSTTTFKNGAAVDPSGRPVPDPSPNTATGENGSAVDPDGHR